MADNRRGKKQNANKNYIAHQEWMVGKKLGRTKQEWVPFVFDPVNGLQGYWSKV